MIRDGLPKIWASKGIRASLKVLDVNAYRIALKKKLLEEGEEVCQTRTKEELAEELGDMLLHIVMLSVFAREDDRFEIMDVINSISRKMVRRHPHVFGNAVEGQLNPDELLENWEAIKKEEIPETH